MRVSAVPGKVIHNAALHEPGYLTNKAFSSASLSCVACSAESFNSTRVALAARTSASFDTSSTLISGDGSALSSRFASAPNFSAMRTMPLTSTGSSPLSSSPYFCAASS
jgi:hypothetical protein